MDEIYEDQVSDTLPLGEVSTITYANQQDGFLFGEMSAHVRAEFGALLEFNCRQEQHRERSPLGSLGKEEHPHMDGYTGTDVPLLHYYSAHHSCREGRRSMLFGSAHRPRRRGSKADRQE
jgi:hypothetical protein